MKRLGGIILLLIATFLISFAATGDQATYKIQRGDSLWKISDSLLSDPLLWPSIWKVNPYIDNPNLIYPGEVLTLPVQCPSPEQKAGAAPSGAAAQEAASREKPAAAKAPEELPEATAQLFSYTPKVLAVSAGRPGVSRRGPVGIGSVKDLPPVFIGTGLAPSAVVVGSPAGITAIYPGKTVALDRGAQAGLRSGQRLWVVHPQRFLFHPWTNAPIGWLYTVAGEVEVTCLNEWSASAEIVKFHDIVQPGDICVSAGDLPASEPDLTPLYSAACAPQGLSLKAALVAPVQDHAAIAAGERVVIDRGTEDGLAVGDHFVAAQEWQPVFAGQTVPIASKALGEIVIIEAAPRISIGIIVSANQELYAGTSLILLP